MIVTVSSVFLLPLLGTLAVMFACWLYYNWRQPARVKSIHDNIYRCRDCGHVYVDRRHVPLSRCEMCGFMNEAVKR
ncbi:MAG: hypothetical protein AAF492_27245 [Verrucomicrobiota bacterium]